MTHPSEVFGAVAAAYARHRLTYPAPFFDAVAARLPAEALVWDCGCGNGQAALDLAARNLRVIGTDASAEQLGAAGLHPLVTYRQARAEASGLAAGSVDAVVVAAALHWFDLEAFNAEVRRVARPGALLAWIGYLPLRLPHPELQQQLEHFRTVTLAPWWAPSCAWVEAGYRNLPFPAREDPFPADLWIERHWTLPQLIAHLGTTSAVQRSRAAGLDLLTPLQQALQPRWPAQGCDALPLRWPFMGRWGSLPAAAPAT
jgi:SAM-dependent methyltransferase